ncbi:MAG: phosphodiester glycosidase family protein [Clostridia bacterium]|nr:phosphodiester glycosidase family protein [Clostridia bacterium]
MEKRKLFDDFDGDIDVFAEDDSVEKFDLLGKTDEFKETDDDAIMAFLEKRRAKQAAEAKNVSNSRKTTDGRHTKTVVNRKNAKHTVDDKNTDAKKLTVGKIIGRVAICTVTFLVIVVLTLLTAIAIICKGPSDIVRDMFVTNMIQTGEMDFLAHIFLSDEEVNAIMQSNEIIVPEGSTDTSLIQIGGNTTDAEGGESEETQFDINGLEIIEIKGKTYKGKIMIVNDPSRISVGTAAAYGEDCVGYTTLYMAEMTNSIAAINGGGYEDKASNKTGGTPMGRNESGVVIANGELKYGNMDTTYEIIGLDKNGILHVDNMTVREALDKGIRDAVNWGPILVKNGEPCVVPSDGANVGFHPRSAIGQRADGAILLLVVDGRQSNSLGASYDDLIEIMVSYGAVNAANLDGGMSSYMVYENEIITEPYLLYDPRNVATSWLVSRVEGE